MTATKTADPATVVKTGAAPAKARPAVEDAISMLKADHKALIARKPALLVQTA